MLLHLKWQFSCFNLMFVVFQNVPLIDGAAGILQCQAYDVHNIGDHYVWYGEVLDAQIHGNNGNQPLIYFAR